MNDESNPNSREATTDINQDLVIDSNIISYESESSLTSIIPIKYGFWK